MSDVRRLQVREGNTGVLELVDENGNKENYQPDCDLDKTQILLNEFYTLKTTTGVKVKDAFQKNGTDWFPTSASMLYWQYFLQVVKYKPLVEAYLKGDSVFECTTPGRFSNLLKAIDLSHGKTIWCLGGIPRRIYHTAVQFRNRLATSRKGDILLFRYGLHDFRTNELLQSLSEKYKVTQVTNASAKDIIQHLFDRSLYIVTASPPGADFTVTLPDETATIFKAALHYAQSLINSNIAGYRSHAKVIQKLEYRLFFGIDDTNIVYPLIYAAHNAGIKTLGIQHGAYTRREASYILKGLERYRWYDNVLVWGDYWKEVVQRNSKLFAKEFHISASNKHQYDYSQLPKKRKYKTILIPYEFLADTISVGRYIRQFIGKGFKVYFKPRPDEPVNQQVDAYYLGNFREDIEIVEKITPEVMAEVDVVAGTQTTLLFDLLPYNKPVWILETSFKFMHDMAEDGFARLIKEEDMERIEEIYQEEMGRKQTIDLGYIFGNRPVTEAVEDYLAGGRASA